MNENVVSKKRLQWSWLTELYGIRVVIGRMWSLKSMKAQ